MANKTATLKNQAGDNIYPNIVGDNRNAAIKDSTTIKHTLVDNKISLDLDEAIKGKIDAALQKPAGLTKTKLVGVGTQGQENIEIGDNLTLTDGKLTAAGGKTYTLSITEVLDTKYVEEIYGYLTNSSESVGKIYPLLKDISDIINNYDSVFISTDDVGLNGGLLFHKQLDKLPTTFSLTYGYFWFATASLGVFDFSTICVSLTNDKFYLGIISSEHLLPKYDNATEGQVLTITSNNLPRWTTPKAVPTITFED